MLMYKWLSEQRTYVKDSVMSGAAREKAFFAQHPKYRSFLSRCTAENLANILNAALVRHIHTALPDLKQRLGDEM
jgi:lipase chaperone LimK